MQLYFKRFDKNGDGRLNFDEFAAAFLPEDNYMAQMLSLRPSNHRKAVSRLDDCFHPETQLQYRHMWISLFKTESKSAGLMLELCKDCFSLCAAFQNIDTLNRGTLTAKTIAAAFQLRGLHISPEDAKLIVLRLGNDGENVTLKQIEKVMIDAQTNLE